MAENHHKFYFVLNKIFTGGLEPPYHGQTLYFMAENHLSAVSWVENMRERMCTDSQWTNWLILHQLIDLAKYMMSSLD